MNIASLSEWASLKFGGKVALIDSSRQLTFREFDAEANRLAHGLAGLGVAKGDRVAILLENCIEYVLAMFAVTKLGGVIVPLHVKSTRPEMAQWFTSAEVSMVITSASAATDVHAAGAECPQPMALVTVGASALSVATYDALVDGRPHTAPDCSISADDLFAIRFTGGTTGVPKGVMMSHRNYTTLWVNLLLNLPMSRDDVALHVHPLSHGAGQFMLGYLACGATQVIQRESDFSEAQFFETVRRHRISSVFILPSVINSLLASDALDSADTSSLRSIFYGSAPIAPERLKQGLAAFGAVFVQIYGASEAAMVATTLSLEDHVYDGDKPPARLRSVGRPGLNVELRIVDEAAANQPAGEIGEIAIRGDHTMVGYWKNPEATARRVRDGWVFTGDMGYLDDEGYLYLVDRIDDLITTGGFNVWPTEVEATLYEYSAVGEVAVFGVPSEEFGEAVTAVVVPRANAQLTPQEIVDFAVARLAKHKVPRFVSITTAPIPKSAVGKPLRRVTRERYLATVGGDK